MDEIETFEERGSCHQVFLRLFIKEKSALMDSKNLCLFPEIEFVHQLHKNFDSLAYSEESQLIFTLGNIENKQYGSVESNKQGTSSNEEHMSEPHSRGLRGGPRRRPTPTRGGADSKGMKTDDAGTRHRRSGKIIQLSCSESVEVKSGQCL
ncbi:hypothetical protein EVAR_28141_1 [Eumeta japonica]|uniref:Uncharacterized protein n=1 Tax=Eumeta variegata TaxID=151549 RepID=A0A4C1VE30_EUMVA|nr:hypothetical protein EVAR_28141_1 [Eumeta japonica]